jgi:hypothetical protein
MTTIDIDSLDEDALLDLNERIVMRLQHLHEQRTLLALQSLKIGSRVVFEGTNGQMLKGTVIRRNRKTLTVCTHDQRHWNVSPSLLRLDDTADQVAKTAPDDTRVVPFAKPGSRPR